MITVARGERDCDAASISIPVFGDKSWLCRALIPVRIHRSLRRDHNKTLNWPAFRRLGGTGARFWVEATALGAMRQSVSRR
jgi:hypothetical protein